MADMGLDMLDDMDVDKVADMVANMVADKKKADLELDMEAYLACAFSKLCKFIFIYNHHRNPNSNILNILCLCIHPYCPI